MVCPPHAIDRLVSTNKKIAKGMEQQGIDPWTSRTHGASCEARTLERPIYGYH